MCQKLWGYQVEEKLHLRVRKQKSYKITGLVGLIFRHLSGGNGQEHGNLSQCPGRNLTSPISNTIPEHYHYAVIAKLPPPSFAG
jgi:hypothetical protein